MSRDRRPALGVSGRYSVPAQTPRRPRRHGFELRDGHVKRPSSSWSLKVSLTSRSDVGSESAALADGNREKSTIASCRCQGHGP